MPRARSKPPPKMVKTTAESEFVRPKTPKRPPAKAKSNSITPVADEPTDSDDERANRSSTGSDTGHENTTSGTDDSSTKVSGVPRRTPDRPAAYANPNSPDPLFPWPDTSASSNETTSRGDSSSNTTGADSSRRTTAGTLSSANRSSTDSDNAHQNTTGGTNDSSTRVSRRTPDRPAAYANPDSPDPLFPWPDTSASSNETSSGDSSSNTTGADASRRTTAGTLVPATSITSTTKKSTSNVPEAQASGHIGSKNGKRKLPTAKGGPKSKRNARPPSEEEDSGNEEENNNEIGDETESEGSGNGDGQYSDDPSQGINNDDDDAAANAEVDVNVAAKPKKSRRKKQTPKKRDTKGQGAVVPSATPGSNKKPRKANNLEILKEIARLQNSTKFLLPKLSFQRCVREAMSAQTGGESYRITPQALNALQESLEMYLTQFFEDAYSCTLHRGRLTLTPKDMQLISFLRRRYD